MLRHEIDASTEHHPLCANPSRSSQLVFVHAPRPSQSVQAIHHEALCTFPLQRTIHQNVRVPTAWIDAPAPGVVQVSRQSFTMLLLHFYRQSFTMLLFSRQSTMLLFSRRSFTKTCFLCNPSRCFLLPFLSDSPSRFSCVKFLGNPSRCSCANFLGNPSRCSCANFLGNPSRCSCANFLGNPS